MGSKTKRSAPTSSVQADFRRGEAVKFYMRHALGNIRGAGTVKAAVPAGAVAGAARLTVVDGNGRTWRPFPSQCKRA